jgi:alkylhydroperoxidase family enzyme
MPWIKTVPLEEAAGVVKEVYEIRVGPSANRGHISPIRQVQSLNPQALYYWMHLNNTILYGDSGLSRAEREMIATVVSAVNLCSY